MKTHVRTCQELVTMADITDDGAAADDCMYQEEGQCDGTEEDYVTDDPYVANISDEMGSWINHMNLMADRILYDCKRSALWASNRSLSYPSAKLVLGKSFGHGHDGVNIWLCMEDVMCYTTCIRFTLPGYTVGSVPKPSLKSNEATSSHADAVNLLLPKDTKRTSLTCNKQGMWTLASKGAVSHIERLRKKHKIEVITSHCLCKGLIRMYVYKGGECTILKPTCEYYEYMLRMGAHRSMRNCRVTKEGGVKAGMSVKHRAQDKMLLGANGGFTLTYDCISCKNVTLGVCMSAIASTCFGYFESPSPRTVKTSMACWRNVDML